MSDELKHECAVAMVVLRRSRGDRPTSDFGGTKLSLLLEKQHNRGQDGAGAAILRARPVPGEVPYWIAKSASSTPLVDVLGAIARRKWDRTSDIGHQTSVTEVRSPKSEVFKFFPRFGEVIVKDAKFRTFIADAAARREFYKHVYDVTYGLVRPGLDTLVVLDDSIVRGNTMKNAILPMLDRLEPKRIVIASSAPPIRYPDCYGIDMSTLGELVAFRALVNLIGRREKLLSLLGDSEFGV